MNTLELFKWDWRILEQLRWIISVTDPQTPLNGNGGSDWHLIRSNQILAKYLGWRRVASAQGRRWRRRRRRRRKRRTDVSARDPLHVLLSGWMGLKPTERRRGERVCRPVWRAARKEAKPIQFSIHQRSFPGNPAGIPRVPPVQRGKHLPLFFCSAVYFPFYEESVYLEHERLKHSESIGKLTIWWQFSVWLDAVKDGNIRREG